MIVADTYNDRIRAIARDGTVSTLAGGPVPGADDGMAAEARFDTPCGVTVDATGAIHVADTGNGAVRRIDPGGAVTTIAFEADGAPLRPIAVVSGDDGALYVSDERGRVVEIDRAGRTRTVAGAGLGFRDGSGSDARFRRLAGIAAVGSGRLIVADAGNGYVRAVTAVARSSAELPWSPLAAPRFDEEAFARTPLLWPVSPMDGPHEIAGTIGEARGAAGSERFHAGVDVRIDEGTAVRAVRDGTVMSPVSTGDFGTLNEWLRLGSVSYVHVRAGRERHGDVGIVPGFVGTYDDAGKLARVRVRRGTHYAAGDLIATVNAFNHVHLNVGWPGEEVNPLRLRLSQFSDTIAPTIAARGVHFFREDWTPIPHVRGKPPALSGRVRIVVDAWDQADGNRPNRRLGLYALGYEVLSPDGRPAPGFRRSGRSARLRSAGGAARCRQARLCAWQRHSFLWRAAHALPLCGDQHLHQRRCRRGLLGHDVARARQVHRPSARARHQRQRSESQSRPRGRGCQIEADGGTVIGGQDCYRCARNGTHSWALTTPWNPHACDADSSAFPHPGG